VLWAPLFRSRRREWRDRKGGARGHREFGNRNGTRLRRYLEARAELWEGQIVASVFLRAYIQGGLLQVEGVPFLLPPIAERYRAVDGILPPDPLVDGAAALFSVRSLSEVMRPLCRLGNAASGP